MPKALKVPVKSLIWTCLLGAMLFGLAERAQAQLDNWNGGTGDWDTAGNWGSGVPNSGTTAAVSTDGSVVNITGTDVQAGTLSIQLGSGTAIVNAESGSISVINQLNIAEGATFNLESGASLTSSLAIRVGEVGVGVLNIYGGSSLIAPNIELSGPGTINFVGTGAVSFGGAISDNGTAGAIVQNSTGTTTLTGNSVNFSGTATVTQGTLDVNGTLGNGSATYTVNGGTLGGSGTVGGNVTVNSGGTLAAGTSATPGTLNIGGTLTLNSGSTTSLRLGGTSSDSIVVGGVATLGGTLLITPVASDAPHGGQTFTLLTASNVSGQFATVTNSLGNALSFDVSYTSTNVGGIITAVQDSFTPFAHNGNQGAVARNLDAVSGDPRMSAAIDYLNSLPGSQLPAAFNAIAPTSQTVAAPIAFNDGRASFRTIDSRLSAIRGGATGLDLSQVNLIDDLPLNSLMAGTDEAPMTGKPFIPGPDNKWGFFAAAAGDFGDIDGQGGAPDSNYYGAGGNAGVDYRLDKSFAVGFQAGYNKDKDDFSNTSAISADTVRFGPYATWHDQAGDWVNAQVGGAYHWYDSQRDSLGGTASGKDTGTEFDASAKYGHDFKLGQWTLTPSFGFDYIELDTAAFSETGSLTPLSLDSQETQSLQSSLGGTAAYEFKWKDIAWQPYVSAGWNHEFLDTGSAATARFASGAGGLFTVNGYDVGHESATFGAGLQATLSKSVTATLGYSGQANNDFLDNSFQAGIRWQF